MIIFLISHQNHSCDGHLKPLVETAQMRGHNIPFYVELTKINP